MTIFSNTLEEVDRHIDEMCAELKRNARKDRYEKFMQSDEWREIRTQRLDISGHRCDECGSTEELHVHHLAYKRFGGDELMTDLKVLCKPCHKKTHGRTFQET